MGASRAKRAEFIWFVVGPIWSIVIWLVTIDVMRNIHPSIYVNRPYGPMAWIPVTLACAILLFRRRSPVESLVGVAAMMALLVYLSYFAMGLVLAVTTALSAVVRRGEPGQAIASVVLSLPCLLLLGYWQDFDEYVGAVLGLVAAAVVIGISCRKLDERGNRRVAQ